MLLVVIANTLVTIIYRIRLGSPDFESSVMPTNTNRQMVSVATFIWTDLVL